MNDGQTQCREKEKRVPGTLLGIMDIENSKNSSIGGRRVTKNPLQAYPDCDEPSCSV